MQAGILSEIITIEKPEIVTDDFGANSVEWKTFKKTRANVKQDSGNRNNENNEIIFDYSVTFTIRYYHEITEEMRIIWENRKYRILSIFPDKQIQRTIIHTSIINE